MKRQEKNEKMRRGGVLSGYAMIPSMNAPAANIHPLFALMLMSAALFARPARTSR